MERCMGKVQVFQLVFPLAHQATPPTPCGQRELQGAQSSLHTWAWRMHFEPIFSLHVKAVERC